MSDLVKIYKDERGEWRWSRIARNGEKIADSAEGYKTLRHTIEMVQTRMPGVDLVIEGETK